MQLKVESDGTSVHRRTTKKRIRFTTRHQLSREQQKCFRVSTPREEKRQKMINGNCTFMRLPGGTRDNPYRRDIFNPRELTQAHDVQQCW